MYSRIQIYLMALGRQYRLEHTTICISHTKQCEWGWEVHTLILQKIFWDRVFFQQNIFLPRHLSHKLRVESECFNCVFNMIFDTSSLLIIWEIQWGQDGHTFRQLLWWWCESGYFFVERFVSLHLYLFETVLLLRDLSLFVGTIGCWEICLFLLRDLMLTFSQWMLVIW